MPPSKPARILSRYAGRWVAARKLKMASSSASTVPSTKSMYSTYILFVAEGRVNVAAACGRRRWRVFGDALAANPDLRVDAVVPVLTWIADLFGEARSPHRGYRTPAQQHFDR